MFYTFFAIAVWCIFFYEPGAAMIALALPFFLQKDL